MSDTSQTANLTVTYDGKTHDLGPLKGLKEVSIKTEGDVVFSMAPRNLSMKADTGTSKAKM